MIHISQESRDCLMRIGNIAYVLVRTVRMERRVGCRVRLFAGILWSSVFTAALPRLFGGALPKVLAAPLSSLPRSGGSNIPSEGRHDLYPTGHGRARHGAASSDIAHGGGGMCSSADPVALAVGPSEKSE